MVFTLLKPFQSCFFVMIIERPKPLFWFRSNNKSQKGRHFLADTITSPNHISEGEIYLPILWGFFIIKGPLKPNSLPNIKIVKLFMFNFKLFETKNLYPKKWENMKISPPFQSMISIQLVVAHNLPPFYGSSCFLSSCHASFLPNVSKVIRNS
jgi:hypothetical protein